MPVQPMIAPRLLWAAVLSARAALALQRQASPSPAMTAARAELLRALEAYVDCLVVRGRPVPYAMRDELRLQRLTCSHDRGGGR